MKRSDERAQFLFDVWMTAQIDYWSSIDAINKQRTKGNE